VRVVKLHEDWWAVLIALGLSLTVILNVVTKVPW